jgi:hypothetical protein
VAQIEMAMESGSLTLYSQTIHDISGGPDPNFQEVLLRLTSNGKTRSIAEFLPHISRASRVAIPVSALLLLWFGVLTWWQTTFWKDNITLFSRQTPINAGFCRPWLAPMRPKREN